MSQKLRIMVVTVSSGNNWSVYRFSMESCKVKLIFQPWTERTSCQNCAAKYFSLFQEDYIYV